MPLKNGIRNEHGNREYPDRCGVLADNQLPNAYCDNLVALQETETRTQMTKRSNKVHVTVTITVRRGDEKCYAQTQLMEEPPTRDPLGFLPLKEIADNIADSLVEMLWDGPNPEWMQDNNGTDPRESLSAPLLNLQKCSIIIVS